MIGRFIHALRQKFRRTTDAVAWHDLRRTEPISRKFGCDRGTPIDRYYVDQFLQQFASDIHGRVLEVAEDVYTRKFGGNHVVQSDILYPNSDNKRATIVGDLSTGDGIPANSFDCLLLTQVLPFIYDIHGTVKTVAQCLKPGGVMLATCPGISQISRYDMDRWGDYWRLTSKSAAKLFEGAFGPSGDVQVVVYGNVLSAVGFLHGISTEELTTDELNHADPDYELVLGIRAQKATEPKS